MKKVQKHRSERLILLNKRAMTSENNLGMLVAKTQTSRDLTEAVELTPEQI